MASAKAGIFALNGVYFGVWPFSCDIVEHIHARVAASRSGSWRINRGIHF
ncbi:hypothetical protein ZBT109_0141 [Zymobacter palmae]|uniref:Uncharacterized protein n=1 Tax=Zymobacter palmae TaxID=33074 RepID=A0A348HBD8_9GAMM|nr:hypothetical protein [Zymobacter palmae]BBG28940.1 hypothetical protein ZBT109_0141 [Zymobacter palmae]